jgi:hypothetical protein
MALHNWPPRRIAILWSVLLVSYLGLVLYSQSAPRTATVPTERGTLDLFARSGPGSDTLGGARWDSLVALTFVFMRETDQWPQAKRDVLLNDLRHDGRSRDSLWRALNVPARLTDAQRDSLEGMVQPMVAPFVTAVARVGGELSRAVLVTLALALAPLMVLFVLTIAWLVLRRRHRPPPPQAAA